MPTGKSPRRSLPYLETTDAPKVHEQGQLLTAALDNDVEGGQGTLAERPTPKLRGRIWVVQGDATAANNGIVWWDTGATWLAVNTPGNAQVYGAETSRAINTLFEPSGSRSTFVTVNTGGTAGGNIVVGGVTIAFLKEKAAYGFVCPAGLSWKYEASIGATVSSSYLPL